MVRLLKDRGTYDIEERLKKDSSQNASQWMKVAENVYRGIPNTEKELPAGVYGVTFDRGDSIPVYIKRNLKTDDIVDLGDPLLRNVVKEVKEFWSQGATFIKMGFLHRRGYLFYGPQGTGKSSIVRTLIQKTVDEGGVVFTCDNPKFLDMGLATFRAAEPHRPVICVFEDIDAIIGKYGEDDLLALLDGANMIDRVLNLATTNYPEKLDRRIVSRPRRFDRVVKIDSPSAKVRKEYFKTQIPKIKAKELDQIVKDTDKLSLAALSEVVISVYCLGNSMDKTLEILRALEEDNPSSSDFGEKAELGFTSDNDNDDDEWNPLD